MVTTAHVADHVDLWLRDVAAEIADLPAIAEWWGQDGEDARLNYALAWDEMMDRFRLVTEVGIAGQLTPTQTEHLADTLASLRDAQPIIVRLGLHLPPLPPEAMRTLTSREMRL